MVQLSERPRQRTINPGGDMQAVLRSSMEKWLCWGSMGVAGLLLLLFLLDLLFKVPFSGVSTGVDLFGIVAAAIVLYLAWDAYKDLR
jgi:threonine/homoserine/homoserine lactone efflux protein